MGSRGLASLRVPDNHAARAAYERESLSDQVLTAVREYMTGRNLTQQHLAAELGVSEGRVSQILSGEQNLTLKTLASLAAALKGHFEIRLVSATGGRWESGDPSVLVPSGQRRPASLPTTRMSGSRIAQGA